MADTPEQTPPPYASFGALESLLKRFKDTGTPARLDRSVFNGASGSVISSTQLALKFFELVDDKLHPNSRFEELVRSVSTEQWSELWRGLVTTYYDIVRDPSIDLSRASAEQVAQAFRAYGFKGSTLSKAVAFFIKAAKTGGIELSPHIKPPPAATSGVSRRRKVSRGTDPDALDARDDDAATRQSDEPPSGMMRITIPLHGLPDGVVLLPEGMDRKQWAHAMRMTTTILELYRLDDDRPFSTGSEEVAQ